MRELSLHILDIAENGITAGADCIQILVDENRRQDLLTLAVTDNGRGMPPEKLNHPTDPFITSRTTRRVGMGLSLLAACVAAQLPRPALGPVPRFALRGITCSQAHRNDMGRRKLLTPQALAIVKVTGTNRGPLCSGVPVVVVT